ncbi:MAG: HD domain-containing protein [Candidatus Magasanikbacteria bacterium]
MTTQYSPQQTKLLEHVKHRIKEIFSETSVPAHGFDHISRVVAWTQEILKREYAKNPLLCELSAWLHDIGRTIEDVPGENSRKHHELSYELLRKWYREDTMFDILSKSEKRELLYAVRYHWNNVADTYDTAWILRDADKLDGFGAIGMKRAREHLKNDEEAYNQNFRNQYDSLLHLKTQAAQDIVVEFKLMEAVEREYKKFLKSKIKKIEL